MKKLLIFAALVAALSACNGNSTTTCEDGPNGESLFSAALTDSTISDTILSDSIVQIDSVTND